MGSHLSEPITAVEAEGGKVKHDYGVSWSAGAMQGWRATMEDAHIAVPEFRKGLGLFGVFDGHGGKEVAFYCRNHLSVELHLHLNDQGDDKKAEALTRAYLHLDSALQGKAARHELMALNGRSPRSPGVDVELESLALLLQRGKRASSSSPRSSPGLPRQAGKQGSAAQLLSGLARLKRLHNEAWSQEDDFLAQRGSTADTVGSTAVCLLVSEEEFICANAGDSRAVLCRGGRAQNLSRDHKPSVYSERRRIEAAGGTITAAQCAGRTMMRVNGLSLSRAIGDHAQKRRPGLRPEQQAVTAMPEICTEKRSPDDEFVVLACNGIWDVKSSQQVIDFVRRLLQRGAEPSAIVEEPLHACLAKSPQGVGCDNMTVVLVLLNPPARQASLGSWLPSPLGFLGGRAHGRRTY